MEARRRLALHEEKLLSSPRVYSFLQQLDKKSRPHDPQFPEVKVLRLIPVTGIS